MKSFLTAVASAAVLGFAAPLAAQPYPQPSAPMTAAPDEAYVQPLPQPRAPMTPAEAAPANQLQAAALPPWMQDDGSSSDHPVPMPGDNSGNRLNRQYQGGIPVAPPAMPPYGPR